VKQLKEKTDKLPKGIEKFNECRRNTGKFELPGGVQLRMKKVSLKGRNRQTRGAAVEPDGGEGKWGHVGKKMKDGRSMEIHLGINPDQPRFAARRIVKDLRSVSSGNS